MEGGVHILGLFMGCLQTDCTSYTITYEAMSNVEIERHEMCLWFACCPFPQVMDI